MGMSTHVLGIRPADEQFKKMEAVWHACEEAGVGVPDDVFDFFANEPPDPKGVVVSIEQIAEKYNKDESTIYDVHLDRLPKDIKIIRFMNSW